MYKYQNGNADIEIYSDGTRVIRYEDSLKLDYPLNIDIRVSTQCSFGQREDGSPGVCTFCHESAKVNGSECDYYQLKKKLKGLPQGIELAIGCNNLTVDLRNFIRWCSSRDYICNLTVNQGHINKYSADLLNLIDQGHVKGLGVSYRRFLTWKIPQEILDYNNTVFHVIAGIDEIEDVKKLADLGVKKILILGEKDFGFNKGKVDLNTEKHQHWRWYLRSLFDIFDVVSFDNLALEQLKPERFLSKSNYDTFNQGENSFYINAVDQYFAPSSRSDDKTSWNISIKDYFKSLDK